MTTLTKAGPYQRIYDDINQKVMAALKKGEIVWRKPWSTQQGYLPSNLLSQKRYRGWNLFYLSWMIRDHGFESPFFLTFLQARNLGGSILKGSKGFPIVKWVEKRKHAEEDATRDDCTRRQLYPILHTVFNVQQTEGVQYPKAEAQSSAFAPIEACNNLLGQMRQLPPVETGRDHAAYRPSDDRIFMPPPDCFSPPEEYYSTLYHEIIHSTGHPKRINRPEISVRSGFGSREYSREELTAEFGAAYLCGICRIDQQTVPNSSAYIRHWLGQLDQDPSLIYKACSNAQAAIDFLLPDNLS